MTTIEEFKNAPVGSIARRSGCPVAVKITDLPTSKGNWDDGLVKMTVETLVDYDYALDPSPVPATAREALDLAWELAYPVKKDQVIPEGTRLMTREESGIVVEGPAIHRRTVDGRPIWMDVRTLDPLPNPEPAWLDAPAVLAATIFEDRSEHRTVFARENKTGTQWLRDTKVYRWDELTDVVPLYPKGQEA